jgi:hypothetical protein
MIDSITRSFCPRHYVQNGLSYLGEETRLKLCLKRCQANFSVRTLGTNKHQLLHRIQSVRTFPKLQDDKPGEHSPAIVRILFYNTMQICSEHKNQMWQPALRETWLER